MSPANPSPPTSALVARRLPRGTVALIDRSSISVAELAAGPRGIRVLRCVLAYNGKADMQYMDDDPESVAVALARVVREHGFSTRFASVGLSESMFGATLCELPRTTPAAITAIVTRQVREQIVDPAGDLLADYACIDSASPAPSTPRRALLAWSSRSLLERHAAAFQREGLHVRRVLPPSVALLDLFGRTRVDDPNHFELFARYCFPSVVIGVHRGRQPLYLRFLPDVMADADEGVVTTLLREVQRTATFVLESHHGHQLRGVVFSGLSTADADRFTSRLQSETALSAVPQRVVVDGPDQGADPERLAALAGLFIHGSPLAGQRVRPMNLMPAPTRRVSRTAASMLVLGVASVVAAFASLGLAQRTVKASTDQVHMLESRFYDLNRQAGERKELLDEAQLCEARRATLELLHTLSGNPVQPLLETLLLIPSGQSLEALNLANPYAVGGERARLTLRLAPDSSGKSAEQRLAFVTALQQRPWCAELRTGQTDRRNKQASQSMDDASIGAWLR